MGARESGGRIRKPFVWLAVATGCACSVPAVRAAHPLQTEDTGTQGEGNVELEKGLQRFTAAGERVLSFQPQVSIGLRPDLDLIVQPSWISRRDAEGRLRSGLGDTHADFKWRWFGSDPWSLALRAGLAFPTARSGLGQDGVAPHATLVLTRDKAPLAWHANLGWTRQPAAADARRDLGHVSTALMAAVSEGWVAVVEAAADSPPDLGRSAWTSNALVGVIVTLRPGFDVDAGRLVSLQDRDRSRAWLLGVTLRFSR